MCSCKHTAINECEIKEKHSNSENSKTKSVFSFGMTFITLLFSAIRKTVFNTDNIKSSNVISEEMYEIEIPIIIEKNLATYEYDSFARGYIMRICMDIWNPLIGEILKRNREPTKEVDKNVVAVMR